MFPINLPHFNMLYKTVYYKHRQFIILANLLQTTIPNTFLTMSHDLINSKKRHELYELSKSPEVQCSNLGKRVNT